jgi:hypothetical protein
MEVGHEPKEGGRNATKQEADVSEMFNQERLGAYDTTA